MCSSDLSSAGSDTTRPTGWTKPIHSWWRRSSGAGCLAITSPRHRPEVDEPERIDAVRVALRAVEKRIWAEVLKKSNWRSPLLVMDEAHHLKNASTQLAKQLQSPDLDGDLKTGDGALAKRFDRMLFLTATPFQLGHRELVHVLQRFGDVRWDTETLGDRDAFLCSLDALKEIGRAHV